jgi:hypothetical protein
MINRSPSPSGKFSVICQSLYLANLLLLPGVFFLVLAYYYYKFKQLQDVKNSLVGSSTVSSIVHLRYLGIGKIHLIRSIQLSMLAGLLVVVIPLCVIYFSSQLQTSIMVGLIYFVTLHAGFVLIGMFNLSRAMANKLPIF